MSEEWRRKAFYHTRVLIPVDEVLESAFGDCLVCLTGGQLNLVRNLLQYADRRSTFVSEYHERFYLAPTTEEWDALQAVVADLERNLMNCEEWSLMLEQVLLQGSSLYGSPATGAVIQPYVEDGTLGPEDPYWDDLETEDPRRCAIAQLTWHVAKDLLEEEVQPAQREVLDAILPIAIAAVGAMMGITVVTLPIAAVYLIVKALVTIWAEGELQNVLDELDSAKHDLVCAMYSGLETSYAAASVNAGVVLDAIEDLSAIDKIELKAAFAPWAMAVAAKGWDNASDWATANVVPGYCVGCPGVPMDWDYGLPPSDGWLLTGGAYFDGNGHLVFVGNAQGGAAPTISGLPYGLYSWTLDFEFYATGTQTTKGYMTFRQKDTDGPWFEVPVFDLSTIITSPAWYTWQEIHLEGTDNLDIQHPYLRLHPHGSGNSGGWMRNIHMELTKSG